MMKDDSLKPTDKLATAWDFDQVLGLELNEKALVAEFKTPIPMSAVPKQVKALLEQREVARIEKNWPEADRLRSEIEKLGIQIEDGDKGQIITET